MKLEFLYQDEDLVIVNKPAGLLVIPDRFDTNIPSLNQILESQLGQKIFVVHRIDRDTSGVICFAKNEQSHKYLSGLFQQHKVGKFYTGLVHGRMLQDEGVIDKPIAEHPTIKGKMVIAKKGKSSVTEYKTAQAWGLYSLLDFRIFTGRTHQIRVHIQSTGHSIVCDPLYGDGKPFYLSAIKKKFRLSDKEETERPLLNRLALHARKLQFTKENGEEISIEAPLPKDIAACVYQLNKTQPQQF